MHPIHHRPIRILRPSTLSSVTSSITVSERNSASAVRKWRSLYPKPLYQRTALQQNKETPDALQQPFEESSHHSPDKAAQETSGVTERVSSHSHSLKTVEDAFTPSALAFAVSTAHAVEQPLLLPQTGPLARLVELIWKFCDNDAVNNSGPWTMNIPIDPNLLPGATLSMSVSYFELSLRFTTTDPRTKKLICLYSHVLQQHLTKLMPTRSVDILVF